MNCLEWVVNWFTENSNQSREYVLEHMEDNYFEIGLIDSFGFIMLMSALEEKYKIVFENDRFQDRSFSTIKGFVKGIEEELEK